MKKIIIIVFIALVILICIVGAVNWLWSARTRPANVPPFRANMKDEDAPRSIEPSLSLQVNEAQETTVFVGTPVWFQLNAANTAAMNDVAGTKVLGAKLARLPGEVALGKAPVSELQRVYADYQKRTAPSAITLGDVSHPWTGAVQFVVRDDKGGEQPLGLTLKPLGEPRNTVQLDTMKTLQSNFGAASTNIAPGTYTISTCLGATGSWKGRVCSDPVKLTVQAMPDKLTTDQQLSLDRQKARFGLLAADYSSVEKYGRELVALNPASIAGHIYLGEAAMGQEKWDVALREFLRARAEYNRQNPKVVERPQYLNARINQLLERTEGKGD